MKEIKWYCDMCGKEIENSPHASYISVRRLIGKHGKAERKIRIMETKNTEYLEFCEDCKATIALLFGGNTDESD